MSEDIVYYICINLESAVDRKARMKAQAEREGMNLHFLPAVLGKNWKEEVGEYSSYDEKRRCREYGFPLLPNEQGCILSHMRALRAFIDSEKPYGCIFEDDIILEEGFKKGVDDLLSSVGGWDIFKLCYEDDSMISPVEGIKTKDGRQVVFIKKVVWLASAHLFTRACAVEMLKKFEEQYWAAFDAQLGHFMLLKPYVVVGASPSYAHIDHQEVSTIDTENCGGVDRHQMYVSDRFQWGRYLLRRWNVLRLSLGKWRMRRMLASRLMLK